MGGGGAWLTAVGLPRNCLSSFPLSSGPPFLETKTAGAEMQDIGEERASTPLGISQGKRQLVVGGKDSTWRLTSTFRPDLWSLEAATEFRGHLQWD